MKRIIFILMLAATISSCVSPSFKECRLACSRGGVQEFNDETLSCKCLKKADRP